MCTLYERISALCKERGVTVSRMCLDLGLSKSTMSDMKSGRKKGLSTTNAQKIATYLNVPVEYLLTGEVPAGFSTDYEENPHELELRDTFETLEIDDQIYVKNWVNSFAKDTQKAKKAPTNGERTVSEDDIKFALFGGDGEISDEMYDEVKRFAAYIKQREAGKK